MHYDIRVFNLGPIMGKSLSHQFTKILPDKMKIFMQCYVAILSITYLSRSMNQPLTYLAKTGDICREQGW